MSAGSDAGRGHEWIDDLFEDAADELTVWGLALEDAEAVEADQDVRDQLEVPVGGDLSTGDGALQHLAQQSAGTREDVV